MDKDLYYGLILDEYLDNDNLTEDQKNLLKEAELFFIEKCNQNMGIGLMCISYIYVNPGQNEWVEYSKIFDFIKKYVEKYAKSKNKSFDDFSLEFINYGRTQLVYVLSDKLSGDKVAILAKQPIVEFGNVKREADNLINLNKVDKRVVAPIDYYSDGEHELYVTPYIDQARCIASDSKWGMYIPEPFYRFENFFKEQESIVNRCMIAKLVSMYNFDDNCGIGSCRLGGGDFMLPKNWESRDPTIENTMDSLYLIAAREMLRCSFDDYLNVIRAEFSRVTINEDQSQLLINMRGRVAMDIDDIESGIKLGMQIINQRKLIGKIAEK